MNPFKSIAIIVKAFNNRYFTAKQDELDQKLRANALMLERRQKSRLQQQIEEIVTVLKSKKSVYAVKVEIAPDCVKYLSDIEKLCECKLICINMKESIYLVELDIQELA